MDDLHAVRERDAACVAYIQPLLFFKGFQALQAYRLAHWLWGHDRKAGFSTLFQLVPMDQGHNCKASSSVPGPTGADEITHKRRNCKAHSAGPGPSEKCAGNSQVTWTLSDWVCSLEPPHHLFIVG